MCIRSSPPPGVSADRIDDLLANLADVRARELARILRRQSRWDLDELAHALRKARPDQRPSAKHRSALHHVFVPSFADVGLVEYRDGTVHRTAHPGWESPVMEAVLQYESPHVDPVIRCLADVDTRRALAALEGGSTRRTTTDLAESVGEEPSAIELHHRHLPRLVEANILSYEPANGIIHYSGGAYVSELLETIADATQD